MDLVRFRYGENNVNTGPLKEIPEICVDHFLGDDINSSVFLLSHAHTDHLVGLETDAFMRRLRQPGVKLYCHPLTPILLGTFERYLQGPSGIEKLVADRKIIPLDVNQPKRIRIPRLTGYLDVTITLLPAGHCPGSVMFLIETESIRILHTGDFRLGLNDITRMSFLHQNGVPKSIDHIYVDTTFCCKSAGLFPDRKQVLREAFDHIRHWISMSKNHVVNISFSAKFAHEYVLLELNKVFGQKIHVTQERKQTYQHIPEVYKIVTLDGQTQLHLCGKHDCLDDEQKILTLRLSSMWYTKTKEMNRDSFITWRGRRFMTLCYSMHASLKEIAEMIDYLNPKIVTPLVLPSKSDISQVHSALRSVTTSSYKFEDYRSARNDFGDIEPPKEPCNEERDETDVLDEEMENPCNDKDNDLLDEHVPFHEEEESPHKRVKLSEEAGKVWKFQFSPSPGSKHSQSSSEDGSQSLSDGSQEIEPHGIIDDFLKPAEIKVSVRRNLDATSFTRCDNLGEDQS